MQQTGEPLVVQALVAESAIEGFNVGVLVGLAGINESQRDAVAVCLSQNGLSCDTLAVISPDAGGLAPPSTDFIQQAREVLAPNRMLGNDRNGFVCGVIDDGQALEHAA